MLWCWVVAALATQVPSPAQVVLAPTHTSTDSPDLPPQFALSPQGEELTIDRGGHGKTHYLVWGIVDWGLASGLWAGSAYMTFLTIVASGTAAIAATGDTEHDAEVRDIGVVGAALTGVMAVCLGGLGAMLANKGGNNIRTYREMKAREPPAVPAPLRDVVLLRF